MIDNRRGALTVRSNLCGQEDLRGLSNLKYHYSNPKDYVFKIIFYIVIDLVFNENVAH